MKRPKGHLRLRDRGGLIHPFGAGDAMLSMAQHMVLNYIEARAGKGVFWSGAEQVGKKLNLHRSCVSRAFERLAELGFLTAVGKKGRATKWVVNWDTIEAWRVGTQDGPRQKNHNQRSSTPRASEPSEPQGERASDASGIYLLSSSKDNSVGFSNDSLPKPTSIVGLSEVRSSLKATVTSLKATLEVDQDGILKTRLGFSINQKGVLSDVSDLSSVYKQGIREGDVVIEIGIDGGGVSRKPEGMLRLLADHDFSERITAIVRTPLGERIIHIPYV